MNAMMHFFFGVPRFIFLTAPLAYLMFRLNIIAASGLMVIAYALPHLWHSTITNSRLQSRYRHSFWGEIYESVLAMYLLKPTLTTLDQSQARQVQRHRKGRPAAAGLLRLQDRAAAPDHLLPVGLRPLDRPGPLVLHRLQRHRGAAAEHVLGDLQPGDDRGGDRGGARGAPAARRGAPRSGAAGGGAPAERAHDRDPVGQHVDHRRPVRRYRGRRNLQPGDTIEIELPIGDRARR